MYYFLVLVCVQCIWAQELGTPAVSGLSTEHQQKYESYENHGEDKKTHFLHSRDRPPARQYTIESQGYFLARYSGWHEFSLRASADASFQFGVDHKCVEDATDSVSKSLAIRASRGSAHAVLLQAGLYYPFSIVYLVNPAEDPYLEFKFKEPHGDFQEDTGDHVFQLGYVFGDNVAKPEQSSIDSSLLAGCKPISQTKGFLVTMRLASHKKFTELDDEFFIEGYKMFSPISKTPYSSGINISPKKGKQLKSEVGEKTKDSSTDAVPLWYLKTMPVHHMQLFYGDGEVAKTSEFEPKKATTVEPMSLDYADPYLTYSVLEDDEDMLIESSDLGELSAKQDYSTIEDSTIEWNQDFTIEDEFPQPDQPFGLDTIPEGNSYFEDGERSLEEWDFDLEGEVIEEDNNDIDKIIHKESDEETGERLSPSFRESRWKNIEEWEFDDEGESSDILMKQKLESHNLENSLPGNYGASKSYMDRMRGDHPPVSSEHFQLSEVLFPEGQIIDTKPSKARSRKSRSAVDHGTQKKENFSPNELKVSETRATGHEIFPSQACSKPAEPLASADIKSRKLYGTSSVSESSSASTPAYDGGSSSVVNDGTQIAGSETSKSSHSFSNNTASQEVSEGFLSDISEASQFTTTAFAETILSFSSASSTKYEESTSGEMKGEKWSEFLPTSNFEFIEGDIPSSASGEQRSEVSRSICETAMAYETRSLSLVETPHSTDGDQESYSTIGIPSAFKHPPQNDYTTSPVPTIDESFPHRSTMDNSAGFESEDESNLGEGPTLTSVLVSTVCGGNTEYPRPAKSVSNFGGHSITTASMDSAMQQSFSMVAVMLMFLIAV